MLSDPWRSDLLYRVAMLPGRSVELMIIAFSSISALGVLVTLVVFIFWRKAL